MGCSATVLRVIDFITSANREVIKMRTGSNTFRLWHGSVLACMFLVSTQLVAATIPVDVACSLVDAITAANTDTATNGCPAGSGADTITLQTDSTITLTEPAIFPLAKGGLPQVKSEITIQGNGAIIERDNTSDALVIRIFDNFSSGTLRLENMTVRNGLSGTNSSGAGIANNGNLTLYNVTVSGNRALSDDNNGGTAGGIQNNSSGVLTIINSTISDNTAKWFGGGILNRGTLTVENSVISGNTTDNSGGGISNFCGATTTITDTTIKNNTSAQGGAGLSNLSAAIVASSTFSGNHAGTFGGGIQSQDSITISNSTFSGNIADNSGGGFYGSDAITFINCTVAENTAGVDGGGIAYSRTATISVLNTIIANNNANDCSNTDPVPDSGSANWFGDASCDGGAYGDPQLGPLAENGGPTQTHAVLDGSPVIRLGNSVACSEAPVNGKDQRGEPRPEPDRSQCDLGAFEFQDGALPPVEEVFMDGFE